MVDQDLQLKLLAAAWNTPSDSHYLRSVPDEYFTARLLRIKNKLLSDEPLHQRDLFMLNNAHVEGPVKLYANSVIEDGFVASAKTFGDELQQHANRGRVDDVAQMLLSPPSRPSLEPPLTVHERRDAELQGGVKFSYNYPDEIERAQYKLGRLYPGSIHVCAADNGVGKSLWLEQLALGLTKEAPGVVDFSVEMPFIHRLFRYIQHQSGASVGLDKYFEGDLSAGDVQELSKRLPQNLYIQNPINITDVLSVAEQLYRQRGVTVFILDFLQALQPLRGQHRYEAIAYNAEAIYHFTKRFPSVWFMASQYNRDGKRNQREDRDGKKAKPSNSDLLGANEIETYAWTISHLVRESDADTRRMLHVTKNRFGTLGEVPLNFNETLLRFET